MVLIVEDSESMRDGLEAAMEIAGYDFVSARDGEQGLAMCRQMDPDLVILDIMLPKLDGLTVARQLRGEGTVTPILMLTARDRVRDRVEGLDAGADDYLPKPFALEELLARIRALLRRHDEAPVLNGRGIVVDVDARQARLDGVPLVLTTIEFDLLVCFLRHPEHVLDREKLQNAGWGAELPETSKSLEVHISTLRAKLEAGGRPRVIETVRGLGYVFRSA